MSTIDTEIRRSACPLTSTLSQLQPVLGQTKPKRSIFGVLSQSSQSAAFPRLFAKEAKQIGVAPSPWPRFLGMGYLTAPAFERVQVGQSPKPWRSAHQAHRLSATRATWRNRPSLVGTISRHVENFVLCTAHSRGDDNGQVGLRASVRSVRRTGRLRSRSRSARLPIIVRSILRRVRIQPKWLSEVTLTSNLPALGVDHVHRHPQKDDSGGRV